MTKRLRLMFAACGAAAFLAACADTPTDTMDDRTATPAFAKGGNNCRGKADQGSSKGGRDHCPGESPRNA